MQKCTMELKPSPAFVGASWVALIAGVVAFLIGLWGTAMQINERGFCAMAFALTLFAFVDGQKNARDSALIDSPSPPFDPCNGVNRTSSTPPP